MVAMEARNFDDLPHVSISEFKANPARYVATGALVTNHGRARAAFVPIVESEREDDAELETAKAQLRLLSRLRSEKDIERELAELGSSRDQDLVGGPR